MQYKKILLALLIFLCIAPVFAADWDNIGIYNKTENSMLIKNSFLLFFEGKDLAKAKLSSPISYDVVFGEKKLVAEFELNLYQDYKNIISDLKLIDTKTNTQINKPVTFAVNNYKIINDTRIYFNCNNSYNSSQINYSNCNKIVNYTEYSKLVSITELNESGLKAGKYKIGIYANVGRGEVIDWIPELLGVSIPQWAIWNESFDYKLYLAFLLNESSGAYIYDMVDNANGTIYSASYSASGKNAGCYDFESSSANYIKLNDEDKYIFGSSFTINVWVKPESSSGNMAVLGRYGDSSHTKQGYWLAVNNNVAEFYLGTSACNSRVSVSSSTSLGTGTWRMLTAVYDDINNKIRIYVDGVWKANQTATSTCATSMPISIGELGGLNSDFFDGLIDELYIWNESKTDSFINSLYDSGAGTFYSAISGNPFITINEPENNTNTTSNSITFNCTAEDDYEIKNMSLYINGSIVETFNFGSSNLTSFSTTKTLNSGNYSWYCSTTDNDSLTTSSDTYYFIIDSIKPQINFIAPENSAIYDSAQTWLNYSIYDLHNDTCWYGNETNNYTINCNLNNWTISTHEGINTLTIWANDTFGNEHSNSTTFIIDTLTPTIEFEYPTNTSYHYVVTNFTYIFTEANPDTCWYSTNNGATNITITCGQNVTGLVSYEGNNTWFLWINDSLGRTNSTNVTFIVDAVPPVLVLHSPLNDSNQVFVNEYPYNVTLNYTATDLSLDSCWYWSDINTTNTTFTCNTDQTITFMTDEPHYIYYYANDSWGNYTEQITFFNVYAHNYSQTSDKNETLEGIDATFTLIVGSTGNPSTSATLLFNNTEYSPDTINQNSTNYFFSKTLTIPTGTGNSTGRLINWYWQYSINEIITDYNTSTQNMTIFAVDLDNCSTYSTLLLNMTLYDENENAIMDISNQTSRIETDISLKLDETTWSYNTTLVNNTNLQICVPDYIFNYSDFLLYMTTYYTATDYAAEFYHIDGQTISKDTIPKIIYLRDLPLKDSTSFIFLFKDQYDIEKSDVIVETLRNYIGSSEYNIVERGKTDDNGQTALHLIEEDAIYRFKIYENEELIFSSIDYKAICEEVPCSIELRQDFETTEIDEYLNNYQGVFSASANPSTRTLEIEYETQNPITLNLTLYQINYSSDEDLIIANDYATATSGKLSVNVPLSYGNDSFYYALTMSNDTIEDAFVSSGWVNLKPKLSESNDAMAWLLSGLFLILMVLFGAAEGLFMIVFLIMGVIAISLLLIVSIPQGIITLIVIGGLAIAWKLYNSR